MGLEGAVRSVVHDPDDSAGVIAPPPLIYLTGLVAGSVLELLLPSATIPPAVTWPLGAALSVAGLLLARSFFAAFRRAGTPVNPGAATTAIVTTGPYRLTRNPAYLGMALAVAGIGVLFSAVWILVALVPAVLVVDRGVIAREERYLERKFGDEYLEYKGRVRRWV